MDTAALLLFLQKLSLRWPDLAIDIPEYIFAGSQSAGKSTVVEGIAGVPFNFTSAGMASRVPIHLSMTTRPQQIIPKWKIKRARGINLDEIVADATSKQVEAFVQQVNSELAKRNEVSFDGIFLELEYAYTPTLGVIDLPGIQGQVVASGDETNTAQAHELKKKIEEMNKKIIQDRLRNKDCTIVCVEKASTDIAGLAGVAFLDSCGVPRDRTLLILTHYDSNETTVTANVEHASSKLGRQLVVMSLRAAGLPPSKELLVGLSDLQRLVEFRRIHSVCHQQDVQRAQKDGLLQPSSFVQQDLAFVPRAEPSTSSSSSSSSSVSQNTFNISNEGNMAGIFSLIHNLSAQMQKKAHDAIPGAIAALQAEKKRMIGWDSLQTRLFFLGNPVSDLMFNIQNGIIKLMVGDVDQTKFKGAKSVAEELEDLKKLDSAASGTFSYESSDVFKSPAGVQFLSEQLRTDSQLLGGAQVRRIVKQFQVVLATIPFSIIHDQNLEKCMEDARDALMHGGSSANPPWDHVLQNVLETACKNMLDKDVEALCARLRGVTTNWLDTALNFRGKTLQDSVWPALESKIRRKFEAYVLEASEATRDIVANFVQACISDFSRQALAAALQAKPEISLPYGSLTNKQLLQMIKPKFAPEPAKFTNQELIIEEFARSYSDETKERVISILKHQLYIACEHIGLSFFHLVGIQFRRRLEELGHVLKPWMEQLKKEEENEAAEDDIDSVLEQLQANLRSS